MVTISFNSTKSGKQKGRQESDVQKECWAYLSQCGLDFNRKSLQDFSYMVPNGTSLGGSHRGRARQMSNLKAQGFRVGVSDIVIAYATHGCKEHGQGGGYPATGHYGAYIELKKEPEEYGGPKAIAARKSAIRPEQRQWLMLMSEVGYFASIAWGTEDFKRLVRMFLTHKNAPPLDWDARVRDTESAQ